MSVTPISFLQLRETIYRKSDHELDLMTQEAKLKMEQSDSDEVAQKIAKLDYILILMNLSFIKYQDTNRKVFEDIYEEL